MLKRLELVGFKSFADKTEFTFPAGITAIVGPNGSGKSNLVDAVRWVLGEQSAKSLRGGEMADVIFNGSTTRRSLGLAEVTLTFDNSRRLLAIDADEVQITRRVYRDGQGEYLINNRPSRLRDIKELLLGSGAGTDAYCIIEQGRVDVLLQASTKDRRLLFEEAAGISRFRAKKVEALRKLERVDLNLQRLRDILNEVEKQLRAVRLQASKAQRYQEYSERLKQLRVGLGLREFDDVQRRLQHEQALLADLRRELAEQARQSEAWDAEVQRLEEELGRLDAGIREQESRLAQARRQIATEETTRAHEVALGADLDNDRATTQLRWLELARQLGVLAEATTEAASELAAEERQAAARRRQVEDLEQELDQVLAAITQLQAQVEADKADHLESMRRAARLHNDAVSFKAQLDYNRRERDARRLRTEQVAESLASLDDELQELTAADEALQARLTDRRQTLAEVREEHRRLQQGSEEVSRQLADLRAERSGLVSRIAVLERLECSREGIGSGVREVFALAERAEAGPWRTVRGMIADVLSAPREYAALLDVALGERVQQVLVEDPALLTEALQQLDRPFSGRVSFYPLTGCNGVSSSARPNRLIAVSELGRVRMPTSAAGTPDHPGVVASAEQLVSCDDPELMNLPRQLLGTTLIVRDLATARAIAAHTLGYRFVTLQGELLEADGTLTVGTYHAETGLLSRKSELRDLREQVAAVDSNLAASEQNLEDLRERLRDADRQSAALAEEIEVLTEQAGDLRSRIGQYRQRREGLHEEVTLSQTEISSLEAEIERLEQSHRQALAEVETAQQQVQALEVRLTQAEHQLRQADQLRQQRQQEVTAAKVLLAQEEARLATLRSRHQQAEAELQRRRQEQAQAAQLLSLTEARLVESQLRLLRASASLAEAYVRKERAETAAADLEQRRSERRQARHRLAEQAQALRSAWRAQQEQLHARELAVSDLRHRRDSLSDRLREDYQIDLPALYQELLTKSIATQQADAAVLKPLPPTAAEDEIADLRRKLERLGSVNLESLQELAELEKRSSDLQAQAEDLTAAKRSLEEIIGKINQDSRRLFLETISSVRGHFQELFRKLFGGGMADIVLEDESDVLESGVEIIARPPGKELRSIAQMSGGEKTLTAVALLLAIFRSKPSPFCILDEVDAALDEANIGRFNAVLREFLDQSHFILITHSKRTMAAADVLYGVTMQESGISKRVAVRLEDWPDDGQTTVEAGNGLVAK